MPNPNSFSVDIQGLSLSINALRAVAGRVDNWSRDLEVTIGVIVQSETDEVFVSAPAVRSGGTVYNGETWPALTDAYLKANPRREGGQILRDYGELLQSLQVKGAGNVLSADANSVTFGTELPKARGLQTKRPFLVPTQRMADLVAAAIASYFESGKT